MSASAATRAVSAAGGAAVLGGLVWWLGATPFLDGLRAVDGRAVAAAGATGLVATVACAWRWQLVARRLGVELALPAAVAAYYRSQLLNTVLPGGVLGDVERGVQSGRPTGDVGLGLRAVAWERVAGQSVQVGVLLVALALLPSPVRGLLPVAAVLLAGAGVLLVVLRRSADRPWRSRLLRVARSDVRRALLHRSAWPGIVLSSTVVVAAHSTTFVVAAAAVGTPAPLRVLVPLALLNLVAMSVPAGVAGWGPREGAAAWSFAASGLGAAQGVAVATAYGVLAAAAVLPGLAVVLAGAVRRRGAVAPVPDGARA